MVSTKILRFLAFQYNCVSAEENKGGQSHRRMYPSPLANTGLVSNGGKNGGPQKRCTSTQSIPATSPESFRPDPPSTQAPLSPSLPLIREQLTNHNMSQTATDIIMASWRSGTSKQYQTYLKRWEKYCQSKDLENSRRQWKMESTSWQLCSAQV